MGSAALQTALFVDTVNDMWDFVDSHSIKAPVGKKPVTLKDFEADMARFDLFIEFVSSWIFVSNGKEKSLPSHEGWKLALSGLKQLSFHLIMETSILTHLCLRQCNQDHVENTHSKIRACNGHNDHPNLLGYMSAVRCLASTFCVGELLDRTVGAGSNCQIEEDGNENAGLVGKRASDSFPKVSTRFCHNPGYSIGDCCSSAIVMESDAQCTVPPDDIIPCVEDHSYCQQAIHRIPSLRCSSVDESVIGYMAGSVVRKLTENFKKFELCADCLPLLQAIQPSDDVTMTTLKEFTPGALITVSESVLELCKLFEVHFRFEVKRGLSLRGTRASVLKSFFDLYDLSAFEPHLQCHSHHFQNLVKALLNGFCMVRVFDVVKRWNKDLRNGIQGNRLNKDKKLNM